MRAILWLLAVAGAVFGQSDSNTITITASRTVPAQPNSATVQVQVALPQASTLDNALAITKAAGFAASDFTGLSGPSYVYNPFPGNFQPPVYWTLSKTVSAADVPAILSSLDSARKAMLQNQSGTDLLYSVSNAIPQAPDCVYPALIGDAQAQAAKVAEAAGRKAGGIISLAQGAQYQVPTAIWYDPVTSARSGDFSGNLISANRVSYALLGQITTIAPPPVCSLIVQFQLM